MKRVLLWLVATLALSTAAQAQTLSGPNCGNGVQCASLSVAAQGPTYTVGSGGNYATLTDAIAALNTQVLQVGAAVQLQLLDGTINEPGAVLFSSAFGKQIQVIGQHTYTFSVSSVVSSSGSAGAWTYTVQAASSVSNIAVGDYVTLYGLSGGTNPTYIAGVWPVTAVNTGSNQITFTTTGRQAAAASGSVAGTMVDMKATLKFANADGLDIWNGATGINLTNFNIVGDGSASHNGISLQDGDRLYVSTILSVANFGGSNILSLYPSELNTSGYLVASSSGGVGMIAENGGTIDSPHIISTGNASYGAQVLINGSMSYSSDAVFSGNGGAGVYATTGGAVNGTATYVTGNTGKGADSGQGGVFSIGTLTSANNGAADAQQFNFAAGFSTTGCVGIGVAVIPTATCLQTTSAKITTGLLKGGSTPTLGGTCTTGSQAGGNTGGKFAATCSSQTVTITFGFTATNGWVCNAKDITTPADTLNQTAYTTTSCTLTGTTAASDTVVFDAVAF